MAGAFEFEELSTDVFRLIAFGEDAQGETYLLAAGKLYKLAGLADESQVAFAAPAASQAEDGGTVSLTVQRTGGSPARWRSIGPPFPGSAGTADYVAGSGTLNWADGVSGNKTIVIALHDDAELEGNENFRVVLVRAGRRPPGHARPKPPSRSATTRSTRVPACRADTRALPRRAAASG